MNHSFGGRGGGGGATPTHSECCPLPRGPWGLLCVGHTGSAQQLALGRRDRTQRLWP